MTTSLEPEMAEKFRFYSLPREERERVVEVLKSILDKEPRVILAVLHGSFLRHSSFRDIDIAVYTAGNSDPLDYKFRLEEELEKTLQLPVDVKVLNNAPPWFTRKVLEEGLVLTQKTPLLLEKLYLKTLDEAYRATNTEPRPENQQYKGAHPPQEATRQALHGFAARPGS